MIVYKTSEKEGLALLTAHAMHWDFTASTHMFLDSYGVIGLCM